MSNILIVGYITEGKTDRRFLESIIRRTFEEIAFECVSEIIVYDVQYMDIPTNTFINRIEKATSQSFKQGVMVLCIHVDADDENDANVFETRINPAMEHVASLGDEACKNIVALVPIQMTEAWMLADKELLKAELGTTLTNEELGLNRKPEIIADPKEVIIEAIRIAFSNASKRRNNLKIAELYAPIGQKISIDKLLEIESYRKFRSAVRKSFVGLNYLT